MESATNDGSVREELQFIRRTLFTIVAVLWAIEVVDFVLLGGGLDRLGITPRTVTGLAGILAAPLLHGSWGHLISNTFGFAILGTLVLMWGRREFFAVSIASALVGGLGTWLVGASGTTHIGVSGVIFGYFGYLVARGFYERRVGSLILTVLVALCFGSMIFGAIPGLAGPGISWEGHLFGAIGGLLVARRFRQSRQ